jgi:hypothetical protein
MMPKGALLGGASVGEDKSMAMGQGAAAIDPVLFEVITVVNMRG